MDTWLLLRDLELGGERNRSLYILKSRGMAHSNQLREFLLTDRGVDLLDVYLGSEGVLTGSARLAQEAREKADALARQQEIERKQRELEREKRLLEAQIGALRGVRVPGRGAWPGHRPAAGAPVAVGPGPHGDGPKPEGQRQRGSERCCQPGSEKTVDEYRARSSGDDAKEAKGQGLGIAALRSRTNHQERRGLRQPEKDLRRNTWRASTASR